MMILKIMEEIVEVRKRRKRKRELGLKRLGKRRVGKIKYKMGEGIYKYINTYICVCIYIYRGRRIRSATSQFFLPFFSLSKSPGTL